jgi:hypothetical protein
VDEVCIEGEELPPFDVHLPLLSLPFVFGTTLATIPAQVPYLELDSELIGFWNRELSYIRGFKVGINWQGNPKYRGDRHRSIPLAHFAALAAVPDVRLINLQKGFGTEQLKDARFSVTALGGQVDEARGAFMDTAAVMKNLDLVVTSDTALAHLAGALGVPVWLALPYAPDWRWLLNREDSPWYPNMRLFRQATVSEWEPVFGRMAERLAVVAANAKSDEVVLELAADELMDQLASERAKALQPTATKSVARRLGALERAYRSRKWRTEQSDLFLNQLERLHRTLNESEIALIRTNLDQSQELLESARILAKATFERSEVRAAIVREYNLSASP